MKAQEGNYGNELADHLLKEAACSNDIDIAYIKILKSAVTSELNEKGVQMWQNEWDASNKDELTKKILPYRKRLQMCMNLSTIVTGYGKPRSYFHTTEDPTCLCKMSPQTTVHLLQECDLLRRQKHVLRNSITKAGGNWPITNSDLANEVQKIFSKVCEHYKF